MYAAVFIIFLSNCIFVDNADTKLDKLNDWDVYCKLQPNSYDCGGKGKFANRFYYDVLMDDCASFNFGTCPHNMNLFTTAKSCRDTCRDSGPRMLTKNLSAPNFCRLQPDFGWCQGYYPSWYFNVSERTCRGFSYSGCGGNMNRFHNVQICTSVCSGVVEY